MRARKRLTLHFSTRADCNNRVEILPDLKAESPAVGMPCLACGLAIEPGPIALLALGPGISYAARDRWARGKSVLVRAVHLHVPCAIGEADGGGDTPNDARSALSPYAEAS
jgi:hypothetical protein